MYSKEILKGIIIGRAKLHFSIYKSSKHSIGYNVTSEIYFRGEIKFLGNLDRTLAQHQIDFRYELKGNGGDYVLVVGKKAELRKLVALVGDIPLSKSLDRLKKITEIQDSDLSKLDKFEALCKIKGVL
jgi:hypothetical protein